MTPNSARRIQYRIGITGQSGFIGSHLAEYIEQRSDAALVPFEDVYFQDDALLRKFVKNCDVVVHLAAASRMPVDDDLYRTNVGLVKQVIDAMENEGVTPLVMFSSSTHETRDTAYGRAKLEGRKMFERWAKRSGGSFVGFVFPNIYGPGARVHYASFIANFAWELNHGAEPRILNDALLKLKYVGNLCAFIGEYFDHRGISRIEVPNDFELKVSDVLGLFRLFKSAAEKISDKDFEGNGNLCNLYNTFVSYR